MRSAAFFPENWVRRLAARCKVLSASCGADRRVEIPLTKVAAPLREVAGDRVVAIAHGLEHAFAIRGEIESAAEDQVEGRARERELPVLDCLEVGTVKGILGRVFAEHQYVLAG